MNKSIFYVNNIKLMIKFNLCEYYVNYVFIGTIFQRIKNNNNLLTHIEC